MALVIEIRDRELYVLSGSGSAKNLKVHKAFRIFLKESLFTNNDVKFDDATISDIKQKLKEHQINDKKVHLVINHRIILTKDLIVPKIDKKKLEFLISNEMTTMLNLTREFVVDYRILDEIEVEGIKQYHCLSSAIRRKTVEGLEILFEGMGMKIVSIQGASNSILNFVNKTKIVDSYEPLILMDASTSYIRYFLFNRGHFSLMRSNFIHIDDDPSIISKRVLHVLDLLSQSQAGETGKPISKILLVGYEKRFSMMQQLVKTAMNIDVEIPEIFDIVSPKDQNLYDFINSLGVLV